MSVSGLTKQVRNTLGDPVTQILFAIPGEPAAESINAFSRVPVVGEYVDFGKPTTSYKVKDVCWQVYCGEVTATVLLEEV